MDAALITIGDIVKLEQGDLVPADIRVLECSPNMCVDNSSLTGESDPIKRKPECTHSDPLETANLCFFGTQVPEGSCVGVVVKIADNTVRAPRFEVLGCLPLDLCPSHEVVGRLLFEFELFRTTSGPSWQSTRSRRWRRHETTVTPSS